MNMKTKPNRTTPKRQEQNVPKWVKKPSWFRTTDRKIKEVVKIQSSRQIQ